MGAGVSQEEADAYLQRQEQLIAKLTEAVEARKQQAGGTTTAARLPAWAVAQQNTFDAPNSGRDFGPPEELNDEFYGLLERARAAERRRVEPPVEAYERELPVAEWQTPTEAEAATLRENYPWLAVMNRPEGYEYGATDAKPNARLELEHVYGFRSSGSRSNLRWVNNGAGVLFSAGGVAVVQDVTTNVQTFFREHLEEISALAVSKDGTLAATADQGKWPSIFVWDVETKKVRVKLSGNIRRAVVSVAFSDCGTYLAAVGLDDDHTVAVYDWKRGRLVADSTGCSRHPRILEIMPNREAATKDAFPFITVGDRHAVWWGLENAAAQQQRSKLTSTPLILGALGDVQTFTTVLSSPQLTIIGTQNGELLVTQGHKLLRVVDAHHGPVLSLAATHSGSVIVSGGYDGYVSEWSVDQGFRRLSSHSITYDEVSAGRTGTQQPNSIRAVDVTTNPITGAASDILVGTVSGGVFRVLPSSVSSTSKPTPLFVAHGADLTSANGSGELTGLAPQPAGSRFVSVGESTLILWDTATRHAIRRVRLPNRGQCAAWGASGSDAAGQIAVGLHNGRFLIYNAELDLVKDMRASRRRVQCLRFSADGTILAVGTADNIIQLYDASNGSFDEGGKLLGSNGVPLSIDFSADGKVLQVANQAYELKYYDLHSMKTLEEQDAKVASNVTWSTFSSLLGWNAQGIWPQDSELNDVTSVSRSSNGRVLATAEESGLVKLFAYPCVGGGIDYKDGRLHKRPDAVRAGGHGGKVTQVQWLNGDQTLISIGGEDLSCFQWRVVQEETA